MEITQVQKFFSNLVLKEPLPFSKKRDVNWSLVRNVSVIGIVIGVIFILVMPAPKPTQKIFYEKSDGRISVSDGGANAKTPHTNNPTEDTLAQLQSARGRAGAVPSSLDHLYTASGNGGGSIDSNNRNSAMVLSRGGLDSKTQLPPGAKFSVTLDQSMTLDAHSMPLIATVNKDVTQEDGTAIGLLKSWWVN